MHLLAANPRVGHHKNAPVPDTDNEGLALAAKFTNGIVAYVLPTACACTNRMYCAPSQHAAVRTELDFNMAFNSMKTHSFRKT